MRGRKRHHKKLLKKLLKVIPDTVMCIPWSLKRGWVYDPLWFQRKEKENVYFGN